MPKKLKLQTALVKHVDQLRKTKKPVKPGKAGPSYKTAKGSYTRKLPSIPYSESDTILLIGEGNFSFSHALSELLHGAATIVATAYDSEEVARTKYSDLDEHLTAISELGGEVLFNVDGTNLDACKPLRNRSFSKIVFNFPHVGAGIKDQDRNIRTNQQLLLAFFNAAISKLSSASDPINDHSGTPSTDGEIHVTLKEGEPYDSWDIRAQAKTTESLACVRSFEFVPTLYPEYEHRRTIGFLDGVSSTQNEEISRGLCRTYVFQRKKAVDGAKSGSERVKRKRDESDSDDDL
ncbi:hypothetical protein HDV00_007630 [Rhizophlyctis rosea]|nr:hypothetical protein HDV00_007630 [Rhizophlyctis rosea]